jgi:hypothetical protein
MKLYKITFLTNIFLLLILSSMTQAQEVEVFDRPSPANANWTSGPEIGDQIPDIHGVDQNGIMKTFDDIKGPNGAYIVFQRSADW